MTDTEADIAPSHVRYQIVDFINHSGQNENFLSFTPHSPGRTGASPGTLRSGTNLVKNGNNELRTVDEPVT